MSAAIASRSIAIAWYGRIAQVVVSAERAGRKARAEKKTPATKQIRQFVEVQALVKNVGEAVAHSQRVGFFRQKPLTVKTYKDPEYLVYEAPLEPLPGGAELTVRHAWELDPEESVAPDVKVYRVTTAIRTGALSKERPPEEWPSSPSE